MCEKKIHIYDTPEIPINFPYFVRRYEVRAF